MSKRSFYQNLAWNVFNKITESSLAVSEFETSKKESVVVFKDLLTDIYVSVVDSEEYHITLAVSGESISFKINPDDREFNDLITTQIALRGIGKKHVITRNLLNYIGERE